LAAHARPPAHQHSLPRPLCTCQGVEAVAVHGDKAQEDRHTAIAQFKAGEKDVLVATDVASKASSGKRLTKHV
jgi:superfamily II DNA/RNA helicase